MLDTAQVLPVTHIKAVAAEFLEGDKIQPGHPLFGLIWINRKRVSGAPCFYGTRVPVKTLFDCLAAGETFDQFLDDFEGVDREQGLAVLDLASKDLLSDLESLGESSLITICRSVCNAFSQITRSAQPADEVGKLRKRPLTSGCFRRRFRRIRKYRQEHRTRAEPQGAPASRRNH